MFKASYIADLMNCIGDDSRKRVVRRKLFDSVKTNSSNSSEEFRRNSKWLQSKRTNDNRRKCKAKRRLNYDNDDIKTFENGIFNPIMENLKKLSSNINGMAVNINNEKIEMVKNVDEFLRIPFHNDAGDRFNLNEILKNENKIEFVIGWMPIVQSVRVEGANKIDDFKSNKNIQTNSFSSGYDSKSDLLENQTQMNYNGMEPLAQSTPKDRRELEHDYTYPDLFETNHFYSLNFSCFD